MSKQIGLQELHFMANCMKFYDFENWIAKEIFDMPYTADTRYLTSRLYIKKPKDIIQKLNKTVQDEPPG